METKQKKLSCLILTSQITVFQNYYQTLIRQKQQVQMNCVTKFSIYFQFHIIGVVVSVVVCVGICEVIGKHVAVNANFSGRSGRRLKEFALLAELL
jgi:hypothetical protein